MWKLFTETSLCRALIPAWDEISCDLVLTNNGKMFGVFLHSCVSKGVGKIGTVHDLSDDFYCWLKCDYITVLSQLVESDCDCDCDCDCHFNLVSRGSFWFHPVIPHSWEVESWVKLWDQKFCPLRIDWIINKYHSANCCPRPSCGFGQRPDPT